MLLIESKIAMFRAKNNYINSSILFNLTTLITL